MPQEVRPPKFATMLVSEMVPTTPKRAYIPRSARHTFVSNPSPWKYSLPQTCTQYLARHTQLTTTNPHCPAPSRPSSQTTPISDNFHSTRRASNKASAVQLG